MKFSISIVAALISVISSVAGYTTPVGDPAGNPIYTPSLGEIVPFGIPYNITWKPTTTGPITLLLLRGPSSNCVPISTLTTGLQNAGWYEWTPGTELEADTSRYGIELVVDGTGEYQYSVQFGIGNDGRVSSSVPPGSSVAGKARSTSSAVAATLDVVDGVTSTGTSTTSPTSTTHSHSKSTSIRPTTTTRSTTSSAKTSASPTVASFDYPTPQVAYLNTTVSEPNLTTANGTISTSGAYQSIDTGTVGGVTVIVLFAMVFESVAGWVF